MQAQLVVSCDVLGIRSRASCCALILTNERMTAYPWARGICRIGRIGRMLPAVQLCQLCQVIGSVAAASRAVGRIGIENDRTYKG